MEPMDRAGAPENQEVKPTKKAKKAKPSPTAQGAPMSTTPESTTPGTETAEKAARPRVSKNFPVHAEILVLSEKNPKRPSSKAYQRFDLYKTGMTVGDFIKAGGTYGDLAWDADRKFISVDGYTPPERPVKEPKAPAETTQA